MKANDRNQTDLSSLALSFYRSFYRPILAVKVRREAKPVGIYLVTLPGLIEDVDRQEEELGNLGRDLVSSLAPPPEFLEESNRRESLRRLSWLMHQLNGPLGRAASGLAHIDEFLVSRPDVAQLLVPNEEQARQMSGMTDAPVSDYSLLNRIGVVSRAFSDIKKVTYQIRRLRRAQSVGEKSDVRIAELLGRCSSRSKEELPNLLVQEDFALEVSLSGDPQMLLEALDEVVSNCVRELKVREVAEPSLSFKCWADGDMACLSITDNALPRVRS